MADGCAQERRRGSLFSFSCSKGSQQTGQSKMGLAAPAAGTEAFFCGSSFLSLPLLSLDAWDELAVACCSSDSPSSASFSLSLPASCAAGGDAVSFDFVFRGALAAISLWRRREGTVN